MWEKLMADCVVRVKHIQKECDSKSRKIVSTLHNRGQ